jgi:GNAT superfamily N-acetyltransferase
LLPAELSRVSLKNGSTVTVRRVTPSDEPALRSLLSGLGPDTRRLRFFTAAANIAGAAHLAALAGADRCGLIATDESGRSIGHAIYVRLDPEHAEVAVEVADDLHGQGLGTILVARLAHIAEQEGITWFVADVLCENAAMLGVFRDGFDARVARRDGAEETVEFLTRDWRLAARRFGLHSGHEDAAHNHAQCDRGA